MKKVFLAAAVLISGYGAILFGILIGYFSTRTDLHLFSGILLGLGIGWTITGRFHNNKRSRKISTLQTEEAYLSK